MLILELIIHQKDKTMITTLVPNTPVSDLSKIEEPIRLSRSMLSLLDRYGMYIPIITRSKSFKRLFLNPADIVYINGLKKSSRTNIHSIAVTEKALKDYINGYINQ